MPHTKHIWLANQLHTLTLPLQIILPTFSFISLCLTY
nr:MAG TPA: hypothetical protein [Caudoviricetes sp.]